MSHPLKAPHCWNEIGHKHTDGKHYFCAYDIMHPLLERPIMKGPKSKWSYSPVNEMVFFQILTATSNITSHMQQVQHAKGRGLGLSKDKKKGMVRNRTITWLVFSSYHQARKSVESPLGQEELGSNTKHTYKYDEKYLRPIFYLAHTVPFQVG